MKVSIVIPYHKESQEQIKPLMRSINEQIGIDFNDLEILLCNDMIEEAPLDNYSFEEYENISNKIIKLKSTYQANPGMSRQLGVDNAKGDYVFFCDADDSLYNLGVLRDLYDNIDKSHADVYRFKFLEEIGSFTSDDLVYQVKDFNWVWVFAKAYKKEFLEKYNIRFNPKNRWHEDTYFNILARYCNPDTVDINSLGYLWRFSRTSITRVNNHEYTFNTIDEYLDSVGYAFEIVQKDYKKNCDIDILKVINTYYKTLLHPSNKNQAKYEYIEKCFYEFINKFADKLFDDIPIDIQKAFARMVWSGDADFLPELSLKSYLKHLKDKYSNKNN